MTGCIASESGTTAGREDWRTISSYFDMTVSSTDDIQDKKDRGFSESYFSFSSTSSVSIGLLADLQL